MLRLRVGGSVEWGVGGWWLPIYIQILEPLLCLITTGPCENSALGSKSDKSLQKT